MPTKSKFLKLEQAAEAAQLRVVGTQDISDYTHARTLMALIAAFDDPLATLYAEPLLPDSQLIPDIVLIHPLLGVLVVEVKAYEMAYIRQVEAGNITIWRDGQEQTVNPLRQAQRHMYMIRDKVMQLALDNHRPLYLSMVALPNISEAAWAQAGYNAALDPHHILFADAINDPDALRKQITTFAHQKQMLAMMDNPLPDVLRATVLEVFGQSEPQAKTLAQRHLPFTNLPQQVATLRQSPNDMLHAYSDLLKQDHWGYPFVLRSVVGGGKKRVMAYQVAYTVLRHQQKCQQLTLFPEDRHQMPKIVVVCLQRSLVPLLRQLIENAYQQISGQSLSEAALTITHLNGFIFDLTQQHSHFHYVNLNRHTRDVTARSRQFVAQLDAMTPQALDELRIDALFVTDGQDIHPETLHLLMTLVRPDPTTNERSISIYYDDTQNIYGNPRHIWQQLGMNLGEDRAAFLTQSTKTTQEIAELGINILLGAAADDHTRSEVRRLVDVQTLLEKGLIEQSMMGWRVNFAPRSHIAPHIEVFHNRLEQVEWVAEIVLTLLTDQQIRPQDILILSSYPQSFSHLERYLLQAQPDLNIQQWGGNRTTNDEDLILAPDRLSMSTIVTAKGYHAPLVILMDADQIPGNARGRTQFFVGVTRAQQYLAVVGVKTRDTLLHEATVWQQNRADLGQ